jgi:hypothetical protein
MGYTKKVAIRVELDVANDVPSEVRRWSVKEHGRPTAESLRRYVEVCNRSYLPGGCNDHLGARPHVNARLIRQANGDEIASWSGQAAEI